MKCNRTAFVTVFAFFLVAPAARLACAGDEPTAIALVETVYAAARANSLDVLRKAIDSPAIARAVLGNYWESASVDERAEFTDALREVIVAAFAHRFSGHPPGALMVLDARTLANGDVLVSSKMTWSESSLTVLDWRIHRCGNSDCIVDVIADGASLAIRRRDEYAARLKASGGSLSDLIASLRQNVSAREKP